MVLQIELFLVCVSTRILKGEACLLRAGVLSWPSIFACRHLPFVGALYPYRQRPVSHTGFADVLRRLRFSTKYVLYFCHSQPTVVDAKQTPALPSLS